MKRPTAHSRKAQIVGQIFVYVLGTVIMGAILIHGYNAVPEFRHKSEQVSTIKLQTDLSSAIDSLTPEYGSVKKKVLTMEDYTRICLVESYQPPVLSGTIDPLIRDSVSGRTGKNVFLMKVTVESSFSVDAISTDPDVLCIPARAKSVELRLESKGDHVVVSQWQD